MIGSLPLAFAQPLILLGLLSLPILWWLLRLVPPRPRVVSFPPTRLLFEIAPKEETPSRTPWWLILLRLLLAALVILAAAGPLWNPPVASGGKNAPLLILVDDGWASASAWDVRLRTADELMARAEADNRGVALAPLSETARDISLQVAGALRVQVKQLKPKPHAVDRVEALPVIDRFLKITPDVEIVWLSDGVDMDNSNKNLGAGFVEGLKQIVGSRPLTIVSGGVAIPHALAAADNAAGALTVKVLRAQTGVSENGLVHAIDLKGLPLGDAPFAFGAGDREAEAKITLPVEIRNDVARLEIAGERSAGAVQLLDKRWRRRTIGIVSGSSADRSQPLLGASYYLTRALNPFADVRLADSVGPAEAIGRFLDQRLPMLVLADVGNVAEARGRLESWVDNGGVLVRFAGPHLAAGSDDLVPVRLRRGGRILGGALSWEKPQQLTAFSREGPFVTMPVPNDVTVTRQVLAEPDATLAERTWATLADGTPLVTAQRRGKGLIVLFHVTADTRWSDLPLSGAFVDMLRQVVSLAGATPTAEGDGDNVARVNTQVVPPTRVLDGFGAFTVPSANARPIPVGFAGRAGADHPPGFYGPPEGLVAVNTLAADDRPAPLDFSPLNARRDVYRFGEPIDLRGPVFMAAFGLMALDALVVFVLAGGMTAFARRRAATAALAMIAIAGALAMPHPLHAQSTLTQSGSLPQRQQLSPQQQDYAIKATQQTHLAYIITGDSEVDAVSRAGLQGLTLFLAQRTALEPGEPVGLDPSRDELSFFPVIYWPISERAAKPSRETLDRIDTYMKQGGMVVFDTRDAIDAPPGPDGETRSPGMVALRAILSSLDVPELEPIRNDHVLNKTFFLLKDFPGRFTNGRLWVEALPAEVAEDPGRPARAGDGVSSIMITSNDLAGAWALRPDGQAMLPLVPGEPRQREFAYRAGVNIVMYALTGNYKADQVHIPALLERLGQ